MFCLVALIIFSILGIFSATHRRLAKEAFDCVFKRITLRPCNTGFDKKIKAKIIGKLLQKNFRVAKFVSRYFGIISWVFVILFFVSSIFSARAIYNLVKYQTCNPQNPQSCPFTPKQQKECQCQEGKVICPEPVRDVCQEGECDQCEGCQR
jgi:hypothetical protein